MCRKTCWLLDDLNFLGRKYYVKEQETHKEIIDVSKYPDEKKDAYAKTARTFVFQLLEPREIDEEDDDELISSDSDLDDFDGFDSADTELAQLDSTLDFDEEDKKMNKIIAFFAKMPKVTGLVQGMLDMMTALTRVLPLVAMKIDDPKLKDALTKTIDVVSTGINKVLKICAFLGIKVEKKPGGAIGHIVKDRFKKDKKDFLEYEIDELNKSLDALDKVDEGYGKPPKGQVPIDVKPNHLYPQRMPLRPGPVPPIVVRPEPPVPPQPPAPPPEPPPIPSVMPEPPPKPPKGENGIK